MIKLCRIILHCCRPASVTHSQLEHRTSRQLEKNTLVFRRKGLAQTDAVSLVYMTASTGVVHRRRLREQK